MIHRGYEYDMGIVKIVEDSVRYRTGPREIERHSLQRDDLWRGAVRDTYTAREVQ
jgi:hypothetical protein